jgi:RNA polymerase sigma-70 factor (ECF subfamily)
MTSAKETCWTVIHHAARGDAEARAEFARRYRPVVHAYLRARWRTPPLSEEVEDAAQDMFVECFKDEGVLANADCTAPTGFRAYLFAAVRNRARAVEARHQRRATAEPSGVQVDMDSLESNEERLSSVFDRAWAESLMREAAARQAQRASVDGEAARMRVELLRLRFQEDLPIREIAVRWGVDADHLHHEYAKARREFREALLEVVLFHHPGSATQAELECERLSALLD